MYATDGQTDGRTSEAYYPFPTGGGIISTISDIKILQNSKMF